MFPLEEVSNLQARETTVALLDEYETADSVIRNGWNVHRCDAAS